MKIGFIVLCTFLILSSCSNRKENQINILFLHHSTGLCIWKGNQKDNLAGRIFVKAGLKEPKSAVRNYLKKMDIHHRYHIEDLIFPKLKPYGWNNYPYDYYNIWVKNGGNKPYNEEPTLEILTKKYQVIILKHCFPVSAVEFSNDSGNINSDIKSFQNYKLQYLALRKKMQEFPNIKFIVWTPSALTQKSTNKDQAVLADQFYKWVINEWDVKNDNIFLWDFRELETEGGLYLKDEYATGKEDSHPNPEFSEKAALLFVNRIVDVIENNGTKTDLRGEYFQ